MNHAPGIGILTTDGNLIIRSWNDWLAGVTGLPEVQVLGRPFIDVLPSDRRDLYRDILAEVLDTRTSRVLAPAFHKYMLECPPQAASSRFDRMRQLVTIAPLPGDARVAGLMITIEDVTVRIDEERALSDRLDAGRGGETSSEALAAVAAEDWRLRGAAVRALRQSASREEIAHLLGILERDHHNLNALSSALQVLTAANRDVVSPLLDLLKDTNANLRMHAALALGEIRDEAAVPALVESLDDADTNVRFHAIEALGRIAAPEAVEALAAIAERGDFFLSFPAVDALAKTEDPRVVPRLTGLLQNELLRPAVVDALGALGDEDCVPALITILGESGDVGAVANALGRIYSRYEESFRAGAHIVELARSSVTDEGVRRLAAAVEARQAPLEPLVAVLGWMGRPALSALLTVLPEPALRAPLEEAIVRLGRDAVAPLIDRLTTDDREIRLSAILILGRLGDRRAVDPLIELLSSPDVELTAATAAALAGLGDPRALDALLPLFAHHHASVRQAAIAAVNSVGAQPTASRVRERLRDPNAHVRECAVRVAGYFGFDDCLPGLFDALEDRHEDVRRAAIDQLPTLDDARALPRLIRAIRDETPRNRAAAAHAMRTVNDPRVAPPLRDALGDADPWVRYFAAGSLACRLDEGASEMLARMAASDPAPQVRIAAVEALALLDARAVLSLAHALMREEDEDLAGAAMSAVARTSGLEADEMLDGVVRASRGRRLAGAVRALASRTTARAADALGWAALISDPPDVAPDAINGLRRIAASDNPDARDAAIRVLFDLVRDHARREQVVGALARLPAHAINPIAERLSKPDVYTRTAAVEALGRMRHPEASRQLARALDDEDPRVRLAAINAFGRLGTIAAAQPIALMRDADPDPAVRVRASAVCERHGWGRSGSMR